MTDEKLIQFIFRGITTEQFALIEAAYKEGDEVKINTTLKVVRNFEKRIVGVFTKFDFEQNGGVFITLEIACHFEIVEESWERICNKETQVVTLPKAFATHLASLSIGVSRGYLHSKLEKLPAFSKYFIPLINPLDLVKEDIPLKP